MTAANKVESKEGSQPDTVGSKSTMPPVAFFIFNRPTLTARVFERIRAAKPVRLLVVADGPRAHRPEDLQLCEAARMALKPVDWPCEVLTNFAEANLGCRRRFSSGLDWVFSHCSEAIVLEDDCLPCASFFTFCSHMLERYRDYARIMHVSGDNFQNGVRRGPDSYFFSRYSLSWGWASWKRAWCHYDANLSLWPIALKERWLESVLDDPLEVTYWTNIFDRLYREEIDAWDYQWLFTCWCQSGLSIQPNENLVSNIGAGLDATNFKEKHSTIGIPTRELERLVHPSVIIRNKEADCFTFKEHIVGNQMFGRGAWFRKARKRLALRTRFHSLLLAMLASGGEDWYG